MASKTKNRFSPEVRTRAVRLVFDHEKDHLAVGDGDFDSREDRLHGPIAQ